MAVAVDWHPARRRLGQRGWGAVRGAAGGRGKIPDDLHSCRTRSSVVDRTCRGHAWARPRRGSRGHPGGLPPLSNLGPSHPFLQPQELPVPAGR